MLPEILGIRAGIVCIEGNVETEAAAVFERGCVSLILYLHSL
jgi:hypothetical protein